MATKYISESDVKGDGGIIKKIITEGTGDCPTKGQEVLVDYVLHLEDGKKVDSSYDRGEPLKVQIGMGQVIKGWDEGILAMKLGEKAELIVRGDYGYGDMGAPPDIGPNATLVFTVDLLQVNDQRATRWQMDDAQLLQVAMRSKEDGNVKFKEKKWKEAQGLYKDGIAHLKSIKNDNQELMKLKQTLLQNCSVATNNTGDFAQSITNCTEALRIDPNSAKAMYLRAIAFKKTHNYSDAKKDIVAAIKLSPKDKNLRTEYDEIKKLIEEHNAAQKEQMKKLLEGGIYNEKAMPVKKDHDALPKFDAENAQTWFDIQIGEDDDESKQTGRVVFELFTKKVPKTAENFRAICTGEKGEDLTYKNSIFHRVIKSFMMQGGDITAGNGTGGKSIYGEKFEDEGIWFPHTHGGVLSMANAGPNTNGSQFFICFKDTPHLDGKHTIFGRVIHGMGLCHQVEEGETGAQDKPIKPVKIVDCGEFVGDDKMAADKCENLAYYDS